MKNENNIEKISKTKIKNWWRWFWITILFLATTYITFYYLGTLKKNYDLNTELMLR